MKNNLFGTYEEYKLFNMIASGYSLNDLLNDMKEHMVMKAMDGTLDSNMNIAFDETTDFVKGMIENKIPDFLSEEQWKSRQRTTDVEWSVLSRHHSDFLISNTADWVKEEYNREFGESLSLEQAKTIAEKIVEDVEEDDEFNEVHSECERTYLNKRFNELKSANKEITKIDITFDELLGNFDFSYTKHNDGYGFIDDTGANLGDIESERYLNPEDMVSRIYQSRYFDDYMLDEEEVGEIDNAIENAIEWAVNNPNHYWSQIVLCCVNPSLLQDMPETLDEESLNMDVESI